MLLENYEFKHQWDTTAPTNMAKIQNSDNTKCWWGYGAKELVFIASGQNGTATLGDSLVFSYKTKHTIQQLHFSVFAKMG